MKIGVIGAGSWGTAVADLLARNGHETRIWALEPEVVSAINAQHENTVYLSGGALHTGLTAFTDIDDVVAGSEIVVSAAPSHAVRGVSARVAEALGDRPVIVVSLSKGLEEGSHESMSQILGETLPNCPVVVLSGPSFAREVHQQQPTAVVAASVDPAAAETVQRAFSTSYFRVYTASDVIGVELCGALKNVIALAAGILDGLGLGFNPRAALVTRGLAEVTRLGVALGADPFTFAGLAGMGDLLLTATGGLSRNRSLGVDIGKGRKLESVLAQQRSVVEGVRTARTAVELAQREGIELPIAAEVANVLFEGKPPKQAIEDLMERELKAEQWQ